MIFLMYDYYIYYLIFDVFYTIINPISSRLQGIPDEIPHGIPQ